jgi:rfaE bifunctional protein kinase chain/domain
MNQLLYKDLRSKFPPEDTTVFVSGDFNILHPGHLRFLKFAKECGNTLLVGVISNQLSNKEPLVDEQYRIESVLHSAYVDFAFILDHSPEKFVEEFKPDIVVKGKEHESKDHPERPILDSYGGKLIFSSGDFRFSSMDILQSEFKRESRLQVTLPMDFIERQSLTSKSLTDLLHRMSHQKAVVIGDTIVDEYTLCDPLGMSQEDPTIVVTPLSSTQFIGGASIVASHVKGSCDNVAYFSVVGPDDQNSVNAFLRSTLEEKQITTFLYQDSSRPTTTKQRFRAKGKTLLRVNNLKEHTINEQIQDEMFEDLKKELSDASLLIFSDFSYGCLPQQLIDRLIDYCAEKNIKMVADSQSSSQTGDITRFKAMDLITPTEREARLPIKNFRDGLIIVCDQLIDACHPKNIFVTLGAEGILIYAQSDDGWITEKVPALNTSPKDISGAGDSMMAISSLAQSAGGTIFESALLGMIAAAIQVSRLGNLQISKEELNNEVSRL